MVTISRGNVGLACPILPRMLRERGQLEAFAGPLVDIEVALSRVAPGDGELHRRASDAGPLLWRAIQDSRPAQRRVQRRDAVLAEGETIGAAGGDVIGRGVDYG